jgi:hypothetical protein
MSKQSASPSSLPRLNCGMASYVQAGWVKDWNAGSWVGFMVLGPVLTAGVCTFVFMTRGMLWGFVVLGGLLAFDLLMYYFG